MTARGDGMVAGASLYSAPPMARRSRLILLVAALAVVAAACGQQEIDLDEGEQANIERGAQLFLDRCAGCHTLDSAGAEGSAYDVNDRERVDGPNFNTRKEEVNQVLYAIRNGGFSGAIMPENIVTGSEARAVAEFLAKYSGREAVDE